MERFIEVNHVNKVYGKKKVLEDINFQVPEGEVFGLLGPSGAGKTTLVKIIVGIETSTSGSVKLFGSQVPSRSLFQEIGYMAQSDALYTDLTAKENIYFFAKVFGLRKKERKERLHEVLEIVGLLADQNKMVRDFSGGMKRRLSLAIALINRPKLLILDEPTVGIDPLLRKRIWDEFTRISQNGTPIIVTTHVMDEAEHCNRLGMIRDGRLIGTGSPEELKQRTRTNTLEDAFLKFGGES